MTQRRLEICIALSLALVAPALCAQERDLGLLQLSLEELLNIQITSATKMSMRSNEAPSLVNVITRNQIDQYGWVSLNDILYKQPGFSATQDYERHTVASRGAWEGWGNNHLLVQLDGIPMNDNFSGSALTSEVTPLFMVKTVEILRGPGSALYGSNATNGVITLHTVSADELDEEGDIHYQTAANGSYFFDVLSGFKGDGAISMVAGYATHRTPGNNVMSYDISGRGLDINGAGTLQQFRTQDRRNNSYAWLKLEGEQGLEGLDIQYHNQYWNYQTVYGYGFWIPDRPDDDTDERKILSVSYTPQAQGALTQEYLLRWQVHDFRWDMRLYPNGAFDGYYPGGANEYVDSSVQDLFGRAEFGLALPEAMNLLAGVEMDRTIYKGDREHYANYNPDTGGVPTPNGELMALGPLLDGVQNNPMLNIAPYLQLSSGELLGDKLTLTLGGRYDTTRVTVNPSANSHYSANDMTETERRFEQFNPRIALVYLMRDDLTLKLMTGKAFRVPAVGGLGGAHSFFLSSEPLHLQAEKVRTTEVALDWRINPNLNWRTNIFETRYEDFIGISASTFGLPKNLFSLKTRGLEAELIVGQGNFSGFLNYSYAKRINETIGVTDIAASPDEITWVPSHYANLGVVYSGNKLTASLSAHYEGSVQRRASDVGVQTNAFSSRTMNMDHYRPRTLGNWITLDSKITYAVTHEVSLFIGGTNLINTRDNILAKSGAFPFDYQQQGRLVYSGIHLTF